MPAQQFPSLVSQGFDLIRVHRAVPNLRTFLEGSASENEITYFPTDERDQRRDRRNCLYFGRFERHSRLLYMWLCESVK
ncbi:hypothetical protein FJTKL_01216 [Diaporthe vaccinii]|uniref:Uncharacterized protein n=1 Tax=Diaporthe vaccinii TaxID=105482 RepID=A0ABR4F5I8_9PEZI